MAVACAWATRRPPSGCAYGSAVTAWDRARDAFESGMTELDEYFRVPLFRQAVLLLRGSDATPCEAEQADDIQRLIDSQDPRNSQTYLAVATRVHERFMERG